MGIVNVTPDSFSEGGCHADPAAAVAHGLELAAHGADIIDVGGESTRPGAAPVPLAEELRRVLPVVRELAARLDRPVSIDTMKPEVAADAVEAGAALINDVGANRADPAMARLVAASGAGYILMHMRGTPADMQRAPAYGDVVAEVAEFLRTGLARLAAAGVAPEQVVLDVGIGFGKTLEHNLQLLAGLAGFTKLGRPVVLGVSRKSFVSHLLGVPPADRLPGVLACTTWGARAGVGVFRTHDVAATAQTLRMTEALAAREK